VTPKVAGTKRLMVFPVVWATKTQRNAMARSPSRAGIYEEEMPGSAVTFEAGGVTIPEFSIGGFKSDA
jgi:hypothetical protein